MQDFRLAEKIRKIFLTPGRKSPRSPPALGVGVRARGVPLSNHFKVDGEYR